MRNDGEITPPSVVLKGVAFGYESNPILAGIDLEIPAGEIWGLIGRSGVGKTTLLNAIAGLYLPQTGSIAIGGSRVSRPGAIKGIVFQDDSLLGWLTIRDNLLFPLHRNASHEARDRANAVLGEVGLAQHGHALPHTLSAGMRKRAEFARALLIDDRYLLADEPFGPLDALTRRGMWKMWQKIRTTHPRTGLLSTHDAEEALRLCDAVVPLVPGPPAQLGAVFRVPRDIAELPVNESHAFLASLENQLIETLDRASSQP
jgi:ABC-type nitrate/sulfonate/bicarbonate transport system ATPase subunit